MNRNNFLQSITILDTETTNLHAEQAEIVEIAGAQYDGSNWKIGTLLMGAEHGIPPEASAKNNISNKMINGLPLFKDQVDEVKNIFKWNTAQYFVAHNSQYDQKVLTKAFDESNDISSAMVARHNSRWLCTHRLAKKLIEFDFKDMQYNLGYLRYRLDLPVPDSAGAHRAGDDTLVCALLFEFLLDYAIEKEVVDPSKDIGKQLHELCWGAIKLKSWPFGKNKGKSFSEIPTDYYLWALKNLDSLNETSGSFDTDLAENVRLELEKRV